MLFAKKDKPRERYYLLPGMGGRANRQKLWMMLGWGLLGGIATSAIVGLALYLINHFGPGNHRW
jgi:hypothetical protein